ncbi:MAG: VCBS repeat-containing protein [Myxococcales bacterium]|nr:VCBS repeat-containing protein [Myxococcales bacterium]
MEYKIGNVPWGLAVGDLNKDGLLDVVTSDGDLPTHISVLLGSGGGLLAKAVPYESTPTPGPALLMDVDNDGLLDVITPNNHVYQADLPDRLTVLFGDGMGSFNRLTRFPSGPLPSSIHAGDFNGDGLPDFITTTTADQHDIQIHLGLPNALFTKPLTFDSGGSGRLDVADLNGDGKLDVVTTAVALNRVSVLIGKGDASFSAPTFHPTGTFSSVPKVHDLDGDGKLDIAVTSGPLVFLFGDGTGKFPKSQNCGGPTPSYGLAIADLNGDGKPDLAIVDSVVSFVMVRFHL